ncbi:tetratricopeptide repeat protein, partial [Candidatus Sumerlaeota bacterium]|nr:tetratricopeptide repeat protein [Candidatus Sumerlaeota bacterium]
RANPDYKDARLGLGVLLMDMKKYDEAIKVYRDAIDLHQDFAPYYNNLAVALSSKGDTEGALENLMIALQLKPDFVDALRNLGIIMLDRNDPVQAKEHLSRALRLSPDDKDIRQWLDKALQMDSRPPIQNSPD